MIFEQSMLTPLAILRLPQAEKIVHLLKYEQPVSELLDRLIKYD